MVNEKKFARTDAADPNDNFEEEVKGVAPTNVPDTFDMKNFELKKNRKINENEKTI